MYEGRDKERKGDMLKKFREGKIKCFVVLKSRT